jgi:transposase-like protein
MKSSTEAPATHYRLSGEVKARVVEEYLDGATAKDVGAKWKISAGSVYRWARLVQPGGKRAVGDARARAHARMVEEEEASLRALNPVGSRALKGLFSPARESEPDADDPHVLMRTAILASGRAMTGRLWAEAKALAALAESYGRLSEKRTGGGGPVTSVDDVPLDVIVEIRMNEWSYMDRMRLPERGDESHPDQIARRRYWAHFEKWERLSAEATEIMRGNALNQARLELEAEAKQAAEQARAEAARMDGPEPSEPGASQFRVRTPI